MRVLITGSNGLLGQKIVKYCLANNIDFVATSKGDNRNNSCSESNYKELDITLRNQINDLFSTVQPTHVIHTAAITNVDYCELNPEECSLVNVTATEYLMSATFNCKAHFQLLSTDFVFDGEKGNYSEGDKVNPLSKYAVSKVKGEQLLMGSPETNWSIVRTIIVYGKADNLSRTNLIVWAKETLRSNGEMKIIDDQFRSPTFADDLAKGCMSILEKEKTGVYHLSGPETMSIYTIVERIAKFYNYSMENVVKMSSATLNQPAKRPPRTGFSLTKAINNLEYSPRKLEDTLDEC